jgi:hypothetical protein
MGRSTFPVICGATRDELVATLRYPAFFFVKTAILKAYDAKQSRWNTHDSVGMQCQLSGRWAIDFDIPCSYNELDRLRAAIHRLAPSSVKVMSADTFLADPAWKQD